MAANAAMPAGLGWFGKSQVVVPTYSKSTAGFTDHLLSDRRNMDTRTPNV